MARNRSATLTSVTSDRHRNRGSHRFAHAWTTVRACKQHLACSVTGGRSIARNCCFDAASLRVHFVDGAVESRNCQKERGALNGKYPG